MFNYLQFLAGSGLSSVQKSLVSNWVGPAFLIVVAVIAITFIIRREIRQLIVFLVIAAVIGAVIYFTSSLFGSGGGFTKGAKDVAGGVNTILPIWGAKFGSLLPF